MHANRYTAVIDACVLAGALPRNMLLTLAEAGFFHIRWSRTIMAETERAITTLLRARGESTPEAAAGRACAAMRRAFPEADVEDFEALIPAIALPDADDRHVVAAAVLTRASVIVTENIRHFPADRLAPFGLIASTADDFLADIIDLNMSGAVAALRTMRLRFKRPELDADALLRRMESAGLTATAGLLIGEIDFL